MAVTWIVSLLFSVLLIRASAAPLKQDKVTPDCLQKTFIQTGGVCDSVEHREIQEICRQIRVEQAKVYNREETGDEASDGISCFGDLLLDKRQASDLLSSLKQKRLSGGRGGRVKRKIRSDFQTNKWSTQIYYKVHSSLGVRAAKAVRDGIAMWQEVTCLQFTETSDKNFQGQHLVFLDGTPYISGCRSYIGRATSITAQPIYLSYNCGQKAVVAHEIAHALGFVHEHQRPDRDSYVTLHTANIHRGYEGFFAPYKPSLVTSLGVEYDYASVMHYYGTAFSKSGYTIETKDPRYQQTIGQRVEISHQDTKLINMAYCADTCNSATPLSCHHHGYQDPHDCSKCRCPDGWEGTLCDAVATGKKAECGGRLVATSEAQYIESPGYSSQQKLYDLGQECTWLIQVPEGDHVKLEFEGDFRLLDYQEACYHWVEVRADTDSQGFDVKGPRYCGSTRPTEVITSSGNQIMVLFRARFMQRVRSEMRGFRLKYLSGDNGCSNEPCQNDGICHPDGTDFRCECKHGFYGITCQDYNFDMYNDIDLVLMVDQTYHSYKDFYYFKALAQHLLSYIKNDQISVRHGIMSFYSSSAVRAELDSYQNPSVLANVINSLYTYFGGTDIFHAFDVLFERYYTSAGADRPSISNVAIMIVDSRHTYLQSRGMIENVQRKLREKCVEVVIVDISSRVDQGLLETLVGRQNVVHKQNYQALLKPSVINSVISKVKTAIMSSKHCLESKTTTTTVVTITTTSIKPTTTSVPSTTTSSTTSTTEQTTTESSTTSKTSTSTTTSTTSSTTSTPTTTTSLSTSTSSSVKPTRSSTYTPSTRTTSARSSTTPTPTATTSATTTARTTSTSTQSTSTTITDSPNVGCFMFNGVCDRLCGGCGYMDVTHYCYVNGKVQFVDEYREPCNASPCETDCSVWIGRLYKRTCKMCCPGYIVQGEVCIQTDEV